MTLLAVVVTLVVGCLLPGKSAAVEKCRLSGENFIWDGWVLGQTTADTG